LTSRRRLFVIYAVLILVLPFAAVQACGPDWTPDTFVRYAVSAVRVPAVARTNAKRFPAPATCDQTIEPWW